MKKNITVLTCDTCGKEVNNFNKKVVIAKMKNAKQQPAMEICDNCADKVLNYLDSLKPSKAPVK